MGSNLSGRDSDSSSSAELEALDQLLHECLQRPDDEQRDALEQACAAHPKHADALRRRFALLADAGMVDSELTLEGGAPLPRPFGGEYRLLKRLGRGGIGVVYLAEQPRLGRSVAIKLIGAESLDAPEVRERFHREAQAAARLDHPNICPVYDVGEVAGTPYIAMRFVEGETLARRIARS